MTVTDVAASGEPLVRSVTRPEMVNGGPAAGAGGGRGLGAGTGAGDGVGVVGASAPPPHAISIAQRAASTARLIPINEKAGSKRTRPTRTFYFLLTFPLFHFSTFPLSTCRPCRRRAASRARPSSPRESRRPAPRS